jgi:hypothetical protein
LSVRIRSTRMQAVRADSKLRPQGRGEGSSQEGEEGNECVCADAAHVRADASVFPPCNFITDATVHPSHGWLSGHRLTVRPSVIVCMTTLPPGKRYCVKASPWVALQACNFEGAWSVTILFKLPGPVNAPTNSLAIPHLQLLYTEYLHGSTSPVAPCPHQYRAMQCFLFHV